MMTEAQVTIVIPAYNAERFIAETLDSLLLQTRRDWCAIVVDDGSTDRTAEIVESYKDPRISLLRRANAGVSAARNTGLRAAQAEYVLFLDADDYLFADSLQRLLSAITSSDSVVLAYGEAQRLRNGNLVELAPVVFAKRADGGDIDGFLEANCASTVGVVLLKRQIVRQVGGFNEKLRFGEDWELYTRVILKGSVKHIPTPPICVYREHSESAVKRLALVAEEVLRPVNTIFSNADLAAIFPKKRLKALKRRAVANAYLFSTTEHLKRNLWSQARPLIYKGLKHRPGEPRFWIFLLCSIMRWIPPQIGRRLK